MTDFPAFVTIPYCPHMSVPRAAVTIVCVFNDEAVRRDCLDRSVAAGTGDAPGTEYIPVDNTDGRFPSAGAALNHGAGLASNDYLVFVHQDVYLHSLRHLEEAAGWLAEHPEVGLLGAIGIAADGRFFARIRDRVLLLGEPCLIPQPVDSLDEVLFMVPRAVHEVEPLTERPEMAWHGYAVEYGLRVRARGLAVVSCDIPLTHNSLTTNLDRLDVAHSTIAATYPTALPVRTTCGTISGTAGGRRRPKLLPRHRWRWTWLKSSRAAHRARRVVARHPIVLADLRRDIDAVLAASASGTLTVAHCDGGRPFTEPQEQPLRLRRYGSPLDFTSGTLTSIADRLRALDPQDSLLLTNITLSDLAHLSPSLPERPTVICYDPGTGYVVLAGAAAARPPAHWSAGPATPAAMPSLTPA